LILWIVEISIIDSIAEFVITSFFSNIMWLGSILPENDYDGDLDSVPSFKIWNFWNVFEFSQGWNNELAASGMENTMKYNFYL